MKIFINIALVTIIISLVSAVSYLVLTRGLIKAPVGHGMTPVTEKTINERQDVFIMINKTHYAVGEKIASTIQNNTDKAIWISTSCGAPFSLLKKNGADWKIYGANPTMDCYAPPIKIEPKMEITIMVDLQKIYTDLSLNIQQGGAYKLEIQYTGVDATLWSLKEFVFLKSSSDEFVITKK